MAEQIGKEDPEHFKARDEGGMAHPDDDLLLAYTRGQLDKKLELIVQQHMARCQGCRQKCIQYQEDNRKLDILAEIHKTIQHWFLASFRGFSRSKKLSGDGQYYVWPALHQR